MKLEDFKNSLFKAIVPGFFAGVGLPFIFIMLDMKELDLEFTFKNIVWIIAGQRSLGVSLVLFPVLFTMLTFFYRSLRAKNGQLILANRNILEAQKYSESLIDSISDFIVVTDAKGKILRLNQSFLKLAPKKDFMHEIIFPAKNFESNFAHNIANAETNPVTNLEVSMLSTVGLVPVLLSSSFIESRQGNLQSEKQILYSMRDISDLKKLQQEIELQRSQTVNASKLASLGEVASGVAHEINNPLTIIALNAEIVQRQYTKDGHFDIQQTLKSMETIQKTVMRATKIVKTLRRLSHNADNENFESGTIAELIDEVTNLIKQKITHQNIELKIDYKDPYLNQTMPLRKIQISQVLINLLNNSLDAIALLEEKWIKIFGQKNDDYLNVFIQDSGTGMPSEVKEHLFQPFFTSKPAGAGTGLGLSISKNILRDHGGDLVLDETFKNTTFMIKLPLIQVKS